MDAKTLCKVVIKLFDANKNLNDSTVLHKITNFKFHESLSRDCLLFNTYRLLNRLSKLNRCIAGLQTHLKRYADNA